MLLEFYTARSATSNMTYSVQQKYKHFFQRVSLSLFDLFKCCNLSTFKLQIRLISNDHVTSFRSCSIKLGQLDEPYILDIWLMNDQKSPNRDLAVSEICALLLTSNTSCLAFYNLSLIKFN